MDQMLHGLGYKVYSKILHICIIYSGFCNTSIIHPQLFATLQCHLRLVHRLSRYIVEELLLLPSGLLSSFLLRSTKIFVLFQSQLEDITGSIKSPLEAW